MHLPATTSSGPWGSGTRRRTRRTTRRYGGSAVICRRFFVPPRRGGIIRCWARWPRFEWAKGELLDAADSPVVGIEDIAAIPPDRWAAILPQLKPAVRRLALEWNVPSLWNAFDRGEAPPVPARTDRAVDWLLWREDIVIRWRSIDPDEAWALQCCADGEDFGSICTGLCERVGEDAAAFRAATYLKQWAADGVLKAV